MAADGAVGAMLGRIRVGELDALTRAMSILVYQASQGEQRGQISTGSLLVRAWNAGGHIWVDVSPMVKEVRE
jgi:hypothetical protein